MIDKQVSNNFSGFALKGEKLSLRWEGDFTKMVFVSNVKEREDVV